MRISKKETINNIPVLRIRNFFRLLHNDLFETDSLKEFLKINNNEVDELINNLLSQEFIQKNSKRYKLTLKGSALRAARCVSPINKEKADKILQEFMNRVEEINTNDYYLYKITKILLFGSYINPFALDYADLDIAFALERKEKDSDKYKKQNQKRIKQAYKEGKCFSSFIDELFYTERLVVLKLKNKNQYISLHRIGVDDIIEQVETKSIYP